MVPFITRDDIDGGGISKKKITQRRDKAANAADYSCMVLSEGSSGYKHNIESVRCLQSSDTVIERRLFLHFSQAKFSIIQCLVAQH